MTNMTSGVLEISTELKASLFVLFYHLAGVIKLSTSAGKEHALG